MRTLTRLAYHQARNAAKLLLGRRLAYASLVSTTLDPDDLAIANEWLGHEPRWSDPSPVARYEGAFAAWNGSRHAYAFMGGRVALSACIDALGLSPGDEVIVPAYTCVVVANSFRFCRVEPVYADIELETFGLDAGAVAGRVSARTRAILLHHLYGLVCRDYEELLELARSRGLKVIEDCAHAAGAAYKGVKVGNRGDVAFYSSERSKPFNTIVGGVAVTNDDAIAARLRRYRDAAPPASDALIRSVLTDVTRDYYQFKHPRRWMLSELTNARFDTPRVVSTSPEEEQGIRPRGYGTRMPGPVAAIALNQLRKLDRYNELRRAQALIWDKWCTAHGYERPARIDGSLPMFLRYPVMVEPSLKADARPLRDELGVEVGTWFVSHLHPARDRLSGFKNADAAIARCINLPTILS